MLIIDAKGQRYLAAAASWAELSAGRYASGPKAAGADATRMAISEAYLMGRVSKEIVDHFVDFRTASEEKLGPDPDDPPPPEEAEEGEASGGTGTAMALEEEKLRRRPPPAIDLIAGQRGRVSPRSRRPGEPAAPARLATIAGEVTGASPRRAPAIVVAAPTDKASVLVHAIGTTSGMIAVAHGG